MHAHTYTHLLIVHEAKPLTFCQSVVGSLVIWRGATSLLLCRNHTVRTALSLLNSHLCLTLTLHAKARKRVYLFIIILKPSVTVCAAVLTMHYDCTCIYVQNVWKLVRASVCAVSWLFTASSAPSYPQLPADLSRSPYPVPGGLQTVCTE